VASWRPLNGDRFSHERVLVEGRFGATQLMSWAQLLKRVLDIDMQYCPNCGGGELKIIAAILRGEPGRKRS
jgi:hypothetical protein